MANRSPPGPQLMGSVTARTALAAMAASMALPPALRISMAACVASGWLVAAIPLLPTAAERVVKEGLPVRSTACEVPADTVIHAPIESTAKMWLILRISVYLVRSTAFCSAAMCTEMKAAQALPGVFRQAEIMFL